LHLGSLVTAVASYLHARQNGGEWLVRIDDIDPPREVPGAAVAILRTLEAFELEWDREVLYQSTRFEAYRAVADRLLAAELAFRCRCSRSELRIGEGPRGQYPGTCRDRRLPPGDVAVRLRVEPAVVALEDALQGRLEVDLSASTGDYVIVRRDGLPAYHLAAVLDDAEQGITTVVRGVDLLESTLAHVHLQAVLGLERPKYFHLPVVVNAQRQKLSKQTGAAPAAAGDRAVAARVLELLGVAPPAELWRERPGVLWRWAAAHWQIESLRARRELAEHY
jgi:glutamyl-Q tRNA(Asp) synthetase